MAVCCGKNHSVCLASDGTVWAFGSNLKNQIGHKAEVHYPVPKQIANLQGITEITCGFHFTVCVDHCGIVRTFGCNEKGQLGLGHTNICTRIQTLSGLPVIKSVHAGWCHTICIDSENNAWSFGANEDGQLGIGKSISPNGAPTQISAVSNISTAAGGSFFTMLVTMEGEVYACGANSAGQLGLKEIETEPVFTPIRIPGITDIISAACGWYHALFLNSSGVVYGTGTDSYAELGTKTKSVSVNNSCREILSLPEIERVSCGYTHSICIDKQSKLWLFGSQQSGKLGSSSQKVTPRQDFSPDVICTSRGGNCTILKDKDGRIWATGENSNGNLGFGNFIERKQFQMLSSSYSHIIGNPFRTTAKSARK